MPPKPFLTGAAIGAAVSRRRDAAISILIEGSADAASRFEG